MALVPSEEAVFAGVAEQSFKHNRLQHELAKGRENYAREQKHYERKVKERQMYLMN